MTINTSPIKLPISQFSRIFLRREFFRKTLLRDPSSVPQILCRSSGSYDDSRHNIAVIGTRRPTAYGLRFVAELMQALAGSDINILSGGALGIDIEAHKQALRHEIPTQAWVVGPLERPSPREHQGIFEILEKKVGCAIFVPEPLEPKPQQSLQRSFWIDRNEWLVAAADALIVVEAQMPSGTWSSVNFGSTFGVPVYALPGSIYNLQSSGTNTMISSGYAHSILSVTELVKCLVVDLQETSYNKNRGIRSASEKQEAVLKESQDLKVDTQLLEVLMKYLDLHGALDLRDLELIEPLKSFAISEIEQLIEELIKRKTLQQAGTLIEVRGYL